MRKTRIEVLRRLLKSPKQSDHSISKQVAVSQPTVSKARRQFEQKGMIRYIGVPHLRKLGFRILAFAKCYCPDDASKDNIIQDTRIVYAIYVDAHKQSSFVMALLTDYDDWLDFDDQHVTESHTLVSTVRGSILKELSFENISLEALVYGQ